MPITRLSGPRDRIRDMAADIEAGLAERPPRLVAKYLYDAAGSLLFERITALPSYYVFRAETDALERHAVAIMEAARPEELLELGPGYARKTELLVAAGEAVGSLRRYLPLDIAEEPVLAGSGRLRAAFPWLEVEGLVGDYVNELHAVPRRGRRLIALLGATLGNYEAAARHSFLEEIAGALDDDDTFLVGVDLVKPGEVILAAYDDPSGLSAEFILNLLRVVNRELSGDFDLGKWRYAPRWDAESECIVFDVVAKEGQRVRLEEIDLAIDFAPGDVVRAAVSCKFTKRSLVAEAEAAGLSLVGWWTDTDDRVALALLQRAR